MIIQPQTTTNMSTKELLTTFAIIFVAGYFIIWGFQAMGSDMFVQLSTYQEEILVNKIVFPDNQDHTELIVNDSFHVYAFKPEDLDSIKSSKKMVIGPRYWIDWKWKWHIYNWDYIRPGPKSDTLNM
jgi:hypothetical protein